MNKVDYIEKLNDLVKDDNKFEKLNKDPSMNIKDKINKLIDEINLSHPTSKCEIKKLTGHFKPGYIYGNPKIHKNIKDPPLRPIISTIGTATHSIAKSLNNIISKYIPKRFTLGSSYEFINLIQNVRVEDNVMASLDVESLFTNVPVDDTIDIILQNVYNHNEITPPPIPLSILKELLMICTTQTPFMTPDGVLRIQKDGVSMGSPLGPTFANFYMCNLENNIIPKLDNNPKIYARYVDDIFLIVKNATVLEHIKTAFENNSVLKFTYETENHGKLNFLDVMLNREGNKISTSVFVKNSNDGTCINFNSICPERYKIGVIKTLLYRAFHLSSDWENFRIEMQRLRQLFVNNNFPIQIVDDTIDKFKSQNNHIKFIRDSEAVNDTHLKESESQKIKLFYRSQMSSYYKQEEQGLKRIIKNRLGPVNKEKQIQLHIYYKSQNLKNLLIKNNVVPDISPEAKSHVVYQYTCNWGQCNLSNHTYIGFTTTRLRDRMVQHKSIKAHHRIVHNRKIGYKEMVENTSVLCKSNEIFELRILEALNIKYKKPSINSKEEGSEKILRIFQ